jgi:hypothetical protein
MKYTNNLFESIKDALNKKTTSENANYKDFMKLETDNTYIVRLIPNLKTPERTMYHYFHHIWRSVLTNQYVSVLCPNTYGEACPIDEYRSKVYNSKNEMELEKIKPLKRNENWLCNVFVIKDPTNTENQGQVKVLRFGKQLYKVISDAISGEDSEEFGAKIFDLSESGCNLRIKVETNEGGYPTYNSSKFLSPSKLEGIDEVSSLYESVKDLDSVFEHKTKEEILSTLNIHFLGKQQEERIDSNKQNNNDYPSPVDSIPKQDFIPMQENKTSEDDLDDKIQDILKDL